MAQDQWIMSQLELRELGDRLAELGMSTGEKPFQLKSGVLTNIYADMRQGVGDEPVISSDPLICAGRGILSAARTNLGRDNVEHIAGEGVDGKLMALSAGIAAACLGDSMRWTDGNKDEALSDDIILGGAEVKGCEVMVCEGTITSGGSLISFIDVLRSHGAVVVDAISLVDRSNGLAAASLRAVGVRHSSVYTLDEANGRLDVTPALYT